MTSGPSLSQRFAVAADAARLNAEHIDRRHDSQQELYPRSGRVKGDAPEEEAFSLLRFLGTTLANSMQWVAQLGKSKIRNWSLSRKLRIVFDEAWYLRTYEDVRESKLKGWKHFNEFGIHESRDPNSIFDSRWYLNTYRDVAASGLPAIVHYQLYGAMKLRDPCASFASRWYVAQHPDASANPLLYHLTIGAKRGFATAPTIATASIEAKKPKAPFRDKAGISVIIPVYRGLVETRTCIKSVLADTIRPPDEIIVVDDCSPESELSAWLQTIAKKGTIKLITNSQYLGFVASVNEGMRSAGTNDVVLLNSDTMVPNGWLSRLEFHACHNLRAGTITPFSNNATICSYPDVSGSEIPPGYSLDQLDWACRSANPGKTVEIPTAVGFAMYITRECLDDVGTFDERTFGLGYGEENDFCLRAIARDWVNLLACDVFVYHKGEVSFGNNSPRRDAAFKILTNRYPHYARDVEEFVSLDPAAPNRFASTAALFAESGKPVVLLVSHRLGGGTDRHILEIIAELGSAAQFLVLKPADGECDECELTVPALVGHAILRFGRLELARMIETLAKFPISRVHVHHVLGFKQDIKAVIEALGVPFDFTAHDYFPLCPRINMISPVDNLYCAEADESTCNQCIAMMPEPLSGRDNIFLHRWKHRWLLTAADRVICPSEDVKKRLNRYGFSDRLVTIPHENQCLPVLRPARRLGRGDDLRITILGHLTYHKGLNIVRKTVLSARRHQMRFELIGSSNPSMKLPSWARFSETGEYVDSELPSLIEASAPDVIWFPAICPETYSYTLSAALAFGRPVVATDCGAFPERLRGTAWAWLVSPLAGSAELLTVFSQVSSSLEAGFMPTNVPEYAAE